MRSLLSINPRHSLRTKTLAAVIGFLLPTLAAFAMVGYLVWWDGGGRTEAAIEGENMGGRPGSVPAAASLQPEGPSAALGWTSPRVILPMAALLAAVGAVAILVISWRAFAPLRRLLQAAQALAAGQSEVHLEPKGNDEIARMGRALQEIAATTEATYHEMEEQNHNLERIVAERTEELRQKNLALAFQNEKVIEANRLKSAFLASISHELRTPLNAIIALSEMLRDGISGPVNEEQIKQAAMIYASGDSLLHLINEVLDLSKIEAGRMDVKPEWVDIIGQLVESGSGLRPLTEEKGLDFAIETEGEGAEVFVDAEKLRQVFINLLGNAIKFTEEGSVIARIRLLPDEQLLYAEVQDTGPGIPPEDQHQVFQEFRQIQDTVSGRKGGTGLGLAISKRLINLLGGDIWFDSDVGVGSRFAFVVPLQPLEEDAQEPVQPAEDEGIPVKREGRVRRSREGRRKRCVLVVDDDIVESGVLGRYLRQQGLEVLTALDGVEAIRALQREHVDLVILDLFSLSDDGLQLLKRIRRDPDLKSLPVVVNTSKELSAAERKYLNSWVHSIFVKGTRGVRDLIDLVTEILSDELPEGQEGAALKADKRGLEEAA